MGNEVDYSKFDEFEYGDLVVNVEDDSVKEDHEDVEVTSEVDTSSFEKLSEIEFEEIMSNVSGWNKLVFDAIDDIFDDKFTLEDLLNQKRVMSYKSRGDNLDERVSENLGNLIDLGLVLKVDKTTYCKLW